jgi:hypothetical protein
MFLVLGLPSPGTPGEGSGVRAIPSTVEIKALTPTPLPEYRERGYRSTPLPEYRGRPLSRSTGRGALNGICLA